MHEVQDTTPRIMQLIFGMLLFVTPLALAGELSGNYIGSWESSSKPFKGELRLAVKQQENRLSADFVISGNPLFKTGKLKGKIVDRNGQRTALMKGKELDIKATINGTSAIASYKCLKWLCFGDKGSITLEKE